MLLNVRDPLNLAASRHLPVPAGQVGNGLDYRSERMVHSEISGCAIGLTAFGNRGIIDKGGSDAAALNGSGLTEACSGLGQLNYLAQHSAERTQITTFPMRRRTVANENCDGTPATYWKEAKLKKASGY